MTPWCHYLSLTRGNFGRTVSSKPTASSSFAAVSKLQGALRFVMRFTVVSDNPASRAICRLEMASCRIRKLSVRDKSITEPYIRRGNEVTSRVRALPHVRFFL